MEKDLVPSYSNGMSHLWSADLELYLVSFATFNSYRTKETVTFIATPSQMEKQDKM